MDDHAPVAMHTFITSPMKNLTGLILTVQSQTIKIFSCPNFCATQKPYYSNFLLSKYLSTVNSYVQQLFLTQDVQTHYMPTSPKFYWLPVLCLISYSAPPPTSGGLPMLPKIS